MIVAKNIPWNWKYPFKINDFNALIGYIFVQMYGNLQQMNVSRGANKWLDDLICRRMEMIIGSVVRSTEDGAV